MYRSITAPSSWRAAYALIMGFMVLGGEWFQMWQSPQWNGQEAAFRFYLTILAVLIFAMQKDE
jgi:predicted small integral membrane protein